MAFQWHGRNQSDGIVWEQEIRRYYFRSEQIVTTNTNHGICTNVDVGSRMKITKSEANKFFKKGYFERSFSSWNNEIGKWVRILVPMTNGTIQVDVEKRELREYECLPEDVEPPKRKKK